MTAVVASTGEVVAAVVVVEADSKDEIPAVDTAMISIVNLHIQVNIVCFQMTIIECDTNLAFVY